MKKRSKKALKAQVKRLTHAQLVALLVFIQMLLKAEKGKRHRGKGKSTKKSKSKSKSKKGKRVSFVIKSGKNKGKRISFIAH